jgi:hypothetical protein
LRRGRASTLPIRPRADAESRSSPATNDFAPGPSIDIAPIEPENRLRRPRGQGTSSQASAGSSFRRSSGGSSNQVGVRNPTLPANHR